MNKKENMDLDKHTILLVDDEPAIISALKRLLRPYPYTLLTAGNPNEAFEILKNTQIDIVISDMRMPQMDGATFLQHVFEQWPDTIRMLLSGFSDINLIIEGVNKGQIYQYLCKPWEDAELLMAIEHGLEKRKLEIEANLAKEKSEISTVQKTKFVERMGVEINQFAAQNLKLLNTLQKMSLNPELENEVKSLHLNTEKLVEVLSDIVDLTKIEQGKLNINNAEFNLINMLNELNKEFDMLLKEKNLKLKTRIDKNIPGFLCGDEQHIYHILRNLFSNAIKYSKDNEIHFEVITKNNTSEPSNIDFVVKDFGCGMPADKVETIFNAYSNCNKEGYKFENKGFGLAVCRELTKLIDGKLGCKSNLNEGSSFWLSIPVSQVSQMDDKR